MYVYTETGILLDRIMYRELAQKSGKPVGISENGLNFLFRQSDTDPDIDLVSMDIKGLSIYK